MAPLIASSVPELLKVVALLISSSTPAPVASSVPVLVLLDPHFERAAELDVGAAAGHVGRDRDRAGHAGFGDDIGFLLVEARVQHREQFGRLAGARRGVELLHPGFRAEIDLLVAVLLQILGQHFRLFDRGGADQHRLQPRIGAFDLGQDRGVFLALGAVDLVVLVETRDRHVGRDFHDLELVDVEQFVGFGQRRTGHAGELFVHPEIVLEGDRGQRLVFRLDLDVLLGFQRLVQAFGIAAALHHAAGELVDDDDFVVADDVVLVAVEQRMRAQRLVDVVDDRDVLDVVERIALELAGVAQQRSRSSPCRLRSASPCAASRRRRNRSCRAWAGRCRWCCRIPSGRRAGRR